MAFPKMIRVRQTFPRARVADIPAAVARTLGGAALRIKRGDTVAVGAGSRGIANIDVIVRATVAWLRNLGARPFVFPAMGSHGGGTADGQLAVLEHYGITEATMGCPIRATMDVVQVGEALGLPVWLDRFAVGGGLDRPRQPREAAHRLQGRHRVRAVQDDDHRPRQASGAPSSTTAPTSTTATRRSSPRWAARCSPKARIGFGARHRRERLRRDGADRGLQCGRSRGGGAPAPEGRARVDGAPAVLAYRRPDRGGDGQEHLGRGHGHQRHRPAVEPARALSLRSKNPLDRRPRPHRGELRQRRPASATPTSPRAGSSTRST